VSIKPWPVRDLLVAWVTESSLDEPVVDGGRRVFDRAHADREAADGAPAGAVGGVDRGQLADGGEPVLGSGETVALGVHEDR
jgi:hypothetical protein